MPDPNGQSAHGGRIVAAGRGTEEEEMQISKTTCYHVLEKEKLVASFVISCTNPTSIVGKESTPYFRVSVLFPESDTYVGILRIGGKLYDCVLFDCEELAEAFAIANAKAFADSCVPPDGAPYGAILPISFLETD